MTAVPPTSRSSRAALPELLTSATAGARALFGAAACSCALLEADGGSVRFIAADGEGADRVVGRVVPLERGIVGWVALTGQPIATADLALDPRFARDVAEQTGHVPASIMAAPLLGATGEVLGVIEVLDRATNGDHTGRDLQVLGVLAGQIATIVELAALLEEKARAGTGNGVVSADELRSLGPSGTLLVRRLVEAVLETGASAAVAG